MTDDIDRAWADYTEAFGEHILPHLLESACLVSIVDDWSDGKIDLRAATELGLMLMLDKPLIVVVLPGQQPPAALVRAARELVWDWDPDDTAAQDRMAEAVKRLTGHA